MTTQQLRDTFRQNYQLSNWKRLLHTIFPNRDFLSRPIQKEHWTNEQQDIAKEISQFGEVKLSDGSLIGFLHRAIESRRWLHSQKSCGITEPD